MIHKYLILFFLLFTFQSLFAQAAKKAAIISVKDDISEHAGDTALKNKLVALGFEVVSFRDGDLDAGQLEEEYRSQDLIVASESVSASKLRKILSYGFSVPTINMEPLSVANGHHHLELINEITGFGWIPKVDENAYKIKILNGDHPLAAGFSTGEVIDLVSDPTCIDEDPWATGYIGWMLDEIGLIPIASINTPGGDTSLVISGIEVGTANLHGDLFNARYVQFNINSFTVTSLTAESEKLFEAAVNWVMDESTEVKVHNIATDYSLSQNYPNPFNPTTNIKYSISDQSHVSLKVFDVLGQEIAVLVEEIQPSGKYEVKFGASSLTNGVYFYSLQVGDFVNTKKMILMK